ncbi:S8 family serine peptidase [Tumebacillus permanentifrigoris]|uniref:PA domain-containing protein n=1 Tax=Tumebacillus permanentifrigoris TaxID=378543 RepID=A0A316D3K5_9BACL|nr:S8 family serine peptidase [Tumebacillus permanentifrigoris]PWK05977.1 PA domain-containing protein [Tumebacillus permanentifrigoris]
MKKKTMQKVSSLALASTIVVAGLPFHSVAGAATVTSVATNLNKQVTQNSIATGGFISPNLDTASTAKVKVLVQMSAQPTAVGRYASSQGNSAFAAESTESAIKAQQASVVSTAKAKGIDLTVNYQFNTVLNGMEVTIEANKIPELAKIPGVVSVFENKTYYAIPDEQADLSDPNNVNFDITPLSQVGAPAVWAKGITGAGLKVGVIDTGVDYMHPDLAPAFKGGFDSFFQDSDPYEEGPVEKDVDPYGTGFEGTSHGTHVSGTIAGHAANGTSDIVQKGVAYEADLYVYKVLGRNPVTGRSSGSSAQVIDGIERAVKDGMDVINLSLGSDAEKDPNSPDAIAINNAVLAGVTAVIANGNAADKVPGQYYYSMGSPASSQLAISVGATTSPANHYDATTKSSFDAALDYNLKVMGWGTGKENFGDILGINPNDAVYVGLGKPGDYESVDVTGKVVLVSRGDIPFVDKIKNAKHHGAKAILIFNGINTLVNDVSVPNLAENIAGRDGNIGATAYVGDSFEFIPAFDMSGKEGRALARQILANQATPLQFTFGADFPKSVVAGDTMATFSSRGPASDGSFGIKPDITAPGVNILSTWPAYKKYNEDANYDQAYNRISGTSMATPHVAGLALLIKQAHPDWTPFDIRAALANTADEISDATGKLYDVYSQGGGRANVAKAVETNAVLQTVDALTILDKNLQPQQVINYNDNASFGLMAAGSAAKVETLQLKNTGADALTYTASVKMHASVTSDPGHPVATPNVNNIEAVLTGVDANSMISAAGHTATQFGLSVKPKAGAVDGVYEGEILLEAANGIVAGAPSLHIPFVVHVGTKAEDTGFGVQEATLSHVNISPYNPTDVSFRLTADDINHLELNVYDLNDDFVGTLAEQGTKDAKGVYTMIAPGLKTFTGIDGSYTDGTLDAQGKKVVKHLKPGMYKLEVNANYLDNTGKSLGGYQTYKTFGVLDSALNLSNVTNTTELQAPVLTLPSSPDLQFAVTKSSQAEYIGNDGILKKLPTVGTLAVDLTVSVSATANPSVKTEVNVKVFLGANSTKPFLISSGSLDRTHGLVAKVKIVTKSDKNRALNLNVGPDVGPAVTVFQLMKGSTPVNLIAVTKGSMSTDEVTAQFQVTGSDYWVQAYVVDSIDSVITSVPTFLGDRVELK